MRKPAAPSTRTGILLIVVLAIGTWFAFTRELPFTSHYEIEAVVRSANNVKENQPVRIAGVDVGKVVEVRHLKRRGEGAVIRMRIEDHGRPIRKDAEVAIRPRLFLEGNWFLDMKPGSPSAPELEDGGTIPVDQTSGPVQLSQLLTALQSDTRENVKTLLEEYSSALEGEGAAGYRRSIPYWAPAYRNTAMVQDATLGEEPRDLSEYVDSAGRVSRALDRNPERLKSLITDFNTAAGAFARESGNLEQAIGELPRTLAAGRPALAAVSESLPSFRRFARDLRPSVQESDRTIDVSMPFLRQARGLVSRAELRGLSRDLRGTVPSLARMTARTPALYEQVRLASSCENEVLHEFSNDKIEDEAFPASGKVYEEAPKPLVGLAGESRNGDANGQWVHVLNSAGDHTVQLGDGKFAQAYFPILGTNPPKPDRIPPFRPDVPCETQEPPDLRSRPGPGHPTVARGLPKTEDALERYEDAKKKAVEWAEKQLRLEGLDREFTVRLQEATEKELFGR